MLTDNQGSCEAEEVASEMPVGRDKPLAYHWCTRTPWLDDLEAAGLPAPRSSQQRRAMLSIALEAALEHLGHDRWISYSRRREFYAVPERYRCTGYSYDRIVPAIDRMTAAGILEHEKADPGSRGRQSRFRAGPVLKAAMLPPVEYDPGELIRLRDENGRLVDYSDTDQRRKERRAVQEINEAIASLRIDIDSPEVARDPFTLSFPPKPGKDRGAVVYPHQNALWRVFKPTFRTGGRLYGLWVQGVPKGFRPFLTIDGEPTREPDYPAHHTRLIYRLTGQPMPADPYGVSGWSRDAVKIATNILWNANDVESAVRAIVDEAVDQKTAKPHLVAELLGRGSHGRIRKLIDAVKAYHRPVADLFHRGAGRELQYHDSRMALRILQGALKRGVVVLPVHDSFIGAERHEGLIKELMTEAFEAVVPVTKLAGIALPAPVAVVLHVWAPGFRPVAMPAASVPEPAASGPVVTLPGVAVLGAPWIASLGDLASRRVANNAPALILTVGDVLGAFEAVAAEGADVIRFPDIAPTGTLFDDMFRVSGPVVARAEFDAWTGGHLTDGLARAVRHELRRRGWTHERLAAHLGLSRKHTTNLINDQFGTCSIVAARLKAWLLQGAMGTPLAA